jgi:flagellar basal-body rod protein FlgC
MNVLSAINTTASALNAERIRMDVVAENIANAHTTHDVDGRAYQRKVVAFESFLDAQGHPGVRVAQIARDNAPGEVVFNPEHPDANGDGVVQMPNVNLAMEMVDLVSASRAYEANLAVVRNAKQMAMKALSIGR